MPSFFGENLKAPGLNPATPSPDGDAAAAAPTSNTTPETGASTFAAKPDDKDDNAKVSSVDHVKVAFQAVRGAEPSVQKYETSKRRKALDKTGEVMESVQEKGESAKSVLELVKPAYDSDLMQSVKDGINKLVDSLPGLLKALNEVAQIHPFIAIAVGAFHVVVELDMKRRDNDKKIGLLFIEMRDMMEALLQLRGITDPESVGPDGQTIKARMQELVKQTAEDIKACANECDTYAKKKLLTKVIASSSWDERLKTFIELFAKRRKAFVFALSIHVNVGVDDANKKLKEIDAKIDVLLAVFPRILSPEQQELAALVEKKGGPRVVMGDNDALVELLKFRPETALDQDKRSHGGGRDGAEQQELFDSPESAVKKNLEAFERKFDLQHKALMDNFGAVVSHEGDRVVEAITAGPHDRIIDPDIHEIWKDMRWPGHVKSRHLVLALRDSYRQQVKRKREASSVNNVKSRLADEDEWALEWINLNRLQAIVEAFDNDASGFITVEEVNYFTTSRPKGWSLPHWLAYWAIGWQMTTTKYRDLVANICAKMFAIRPHIHPANRHAVDKYLQSVWQKITTLTLSFANTNQPDSLQDRFKSYVEAEEKRLREGLETVRYDIDTMDTLLLVTGPGRIEKHLFPVLWLLLRRDFEIFRLCRHTIIHKDELWDSADTILWVLDAVSERHNDLEALFKQQKLDPGLRFRDFACQLYDYWHEFDRFWMLEHQRRLDFAEVEYDDGKEEKTVDVSKLLNYPSAADNMYPARVEDSVTYNDVAADEAVRLVLGRWNGIQISEDDIVLPMITFYLHASVDPRSYGASSIGANGTDYNILGDYITKDDGTVEYSFTKTYVARFPKTYWTATLEEDRQTLSGRWGYNKDDQPWTFVFKRIPPEVLVDRPHPREFVEHRVNALWKYALTAVHNQVRRRLFSWTYIAERRDRRNAYLDLLLKEVNTQLPREDAARLFSWTYIAERRDRRNEYSDLLWKEVNTQLTRDDAARASALAQRSTFDEVRCFYIQQEYRQRVVPPHLGVVCDICREPIYGTRVVCLECGLRFTLDFCDKPECVGCTVESRDDIDVASPHLPTHDFVKIRAPILHYREIGRVLRDAKAGLERAKSLLDEVEFRSRARGFLASFREAQVGRGEKPDENGERNGKDGDHIDVEEAAASPETDNVLERREVVESPNAESENELPSLTCLRCKSPITRPFLYCIDCPEYSAPFICWDCDEQEAGFDQGEHHLATHNLVRCMEVLREAEVLGVEEDPTEKRLGALEQQMVGLRDQMGKIEALLHALANARAK